MRFLVRTNPHLGESFSSYLQRVSKLNYINPHDIWRLFIREDTHYPQSSFSAALDICPENIIELDEFASALNLKRFQLENLTFAPVFQKFGIPLESIHSSRILSNITENYRRYCPKCLEESPYYKLVWQIAEIKFCPTHNIELLSECKQCKKSTPILPSNCEIGVCPKCNWNFKNGISHVYQLNPKDLRIVEDWTYLLDPSTDKLKLTPGLTYEQSLASRLLYILNSRDLEINRAERTRLSSIRQIARNTKVRQTYIHLNSILHFVRKCNITLEEFFKLEVPESYVNSLLEQKKKMVDSYYCIAPWCSHYKIPGSLERTSTSIKVLKSGDKQKYYMYCSDCGTEYCISKNDNSITERGNSINFAWNTVRNELSADCSFTELSRRIGVSEDKLRRALIFLLSNHLVNRQLVPLVTPLSHDHKILTDIKRLIEMGIPAKSIKQKLHLNYNDFLFYWLSREIRLAKIIGIRKKPDKLHNIDERVILFENAINELTTENIPITIGSVCNKLNIAPETLRYWGFLDKLKDCKALQRKNNEKQFEENIISRTEEILDDALSRGETISSENLYKMLGVKRTVLVRRFPHLTQFIHSKLMATNKLIY